ncbi:MAG: substrate-binding domain-containing protein, partial [Rhodothermales bacterium]|nr:substrate-binding domain-containing protein [Rhodothermales bacterium]
VGGPSSASDAQGRLQAYRDTLSARGLVPTPEREFEGKFRFEDGYQAVRHILAMSPRPTAVIASNDQTAFGVLTALRERDVRVPEEISVTGFDDVPSASYYPPPLTTARVPVRYLGEVAVETLVDRLSTQSSRTPLRRTLDVELVVRESTAPPPTSRPR